MSTPAADRELRDLLEQAQTELKRARDELLLSRAAEVGLREKVEFLEWSLNGGEKGDLVEALAKSRTEIAQLQRRVADLAGLRVQPANVVADATARVCLISVTTQGTALSVETFIAFRVGVDGRARDIVRTEDRTKALAEAAAVARELEVPFEDLT